MILVLFFLAIVTTLFILIMIILLSNIQIEFINANLTLKSFNSKCCKIDDDIKIRLKVYLLNRLKIFKIEVDKNKLIKFRIWEKIQKVDLKKIRKDFKIDKEIIQYLKLIKAQILKINLDINIGTEDVITTSFLVFFVSSFISILLANAIKKIDSRMHNYSINPIYQNKNIIKIKLNCIINVKIGHIIHMIYNIFKKRRIDISGETCNRRSHDYSYE